MSFSRSLNGTALIAIAALVSIAAERRATDESYSAGAGVTEGHQKQITAITDGLKPVLEALPPDASVSGSVRGHANADESGDWGFSLSVSLSGGGTTPAVAPAAPSDEPAAATT